MTMAEAPSSRPTPRAVTRPFAWAKSRSFVLAAGCLVVALSVVLGCSVGAVHVPPLEVLQSVLGLETPHREMLMSIRFPRVALGLLVGSGLGLSGASLQGVFRNPIVDPGFLGISTGAVLFAVVAVVLGGHGAVSTMRTALGAPLLLSAAAFVGALVAMLSVRWLATVEGRLSLTALLLSGLAVNTVAGALTGVLLYAATDVQVVTVTFWTFGSLGGATWGTVLRVAPIFFLGLLTLPRLGRSLDALVLGDAEAGHLGILVERTKLLVIVVSALLVGAQVAVSGLVGFVGLVIPHVLRLWAGASHKTLLPASALFGAALVVLADTTARILVKPAELPLGVITAALGAPFFLALLLKERRRLV